MITLARKLGTTEHLSPLLRKARRLGLDTPRALEILAVQRGCQHYQRGDEPPTEPVSQESFSNEELALALLNITLPYDPHRIRCGAAMLSAKGNDPKLLARLAIAERTVPVVRYIAQAGQHFEPQEPFWKELLPLLPQSPSPKAGVMPHPTRFVTMTGVVRGQPPGMQTQWQRPQPRAAAT